VAVDERLHRRSQAVTGAAHVMGERPGSVRYIPL
jgi:hypothetical protein